MVFDLKQDPHTEHAKALSALKTTTVAFKALISQTRQILEDNCFSLLSEAATQSAQPVQFLFCTM